MCEKLRDTNKKLIIFDLDGTLVYTLDDLVKAVQATQKYFNKPILSPEEIKGYIGKGMRYLVLKSLSIPESSPLADKAVEYFRSYYAQHITDNSKLYPGIKEVIESLSRNGKILTVLSNKPVELSRQLLNKLGISSFFEEIYGGGSFKYLKPHPEPIIKIMSIFSIPPEKTILIGDSSIDTKTALDANIDCIGVLWGYTQKEHFNPQPSCFASKPQDILDILSI